MPCRIFLIFHFIFGAFSYTNSKVLFAIKRYVITVFLAIDSDKDMKRQVFIDLVNLSPSSQSVTTRVGFTATVGMCYCYRPKIILHRVRKKGATILLPVTPRNSNRFSKYFYHHALQ